MAEPAVIVEKDGAVLTVTLNRPEKRNAINCESMCRLYDAWVQLDQDDDLRVAILTGKGNTFCAGMDLAEIAKMSAPMLATLDIQLPDGSGADLIPVIRARPGWERVPIVMVTAQARHEDVSGALKSGASAYLVKPFKPEVLRDTVRLILKRGGPFKP